MTMKHPRPHRTGNLLAALAGSFALLASHIQGAETPKAKIVDPSIQGEEIAQLTFAPNVFGLYESPGLGLVGILCFVGGAGSLVWSMREASDDDPDDGAVL